MVIKKRGLGRGLDALLSGTTINQPNDSDTSSRELSTEALQRGQYQPRQTIKDEPLAELAQSIAKQGIIQPIVVRPIDDEKYEIIAGERRWQAAKLAGLKQVPVIIKNVDDSAAIAMSLIENIQRENLNPIEEATALHRLMQEFNLTQQEVADSVGKSRSTVANLLRLLNLPELIKKMLANAQLEMGHARALLSLDEPEQSSTAKIVADKQLTVRATEALVKKIQHTVVKKPDVVIDPNIEKIKTDLELILSAKINLKYNKYGVGSLTIQYNSLAELDTILTHIN